MDGLLECLPVRESSVSFQVTPEIRETKYVRLFGMTTSGKMVPFRTVIIGSKDNYQFELPPYESFKEVCVVKADLYYHEPHLFSVNPDDPLEGGDKRQHENRLPIVFIHGLWRSELTPPEPKYGRWMYAQKFQTFIHLIQALKPMRDKVKIYAYVYPAHYLSLQEHADNLIALMKKSKTLSSTAPVLIGHSFGGLVAREVARKYPVRSVVTMATPHKGTPIIDYMYMGYRDFKKMWGAYPDLMMGLYRIRESMFMSGAFVVSPAHEHLFWQDEAVKYEGKVPVYLVSPWLDIEVSPEMLGAMLREAFEKPEVVDSYLFAGRLMAFMGQSMNRSGWSQNDGAVPMESSREGLSGEAVVKLPHLMGDHETPLLAKDYFVSHVLPSIIAGA